LREIIVQDVYNVTQISSSNNEAWERLLRIVNESDDDVMLDFRGIQLIEPWNNLLFRKLMSKNNVYMRLYMSEREKKVLDLLCKISKEDMPEGHIINVEDDEIIEDVKQEVVPDKTFELIKGRVLECAKIIKSKPTKVVFEIPKVVDQLGSIKTIKAIEEVVKQLNDEKGIKNFEVDAEGLFIQINIIEYLARVIGQMMQEGIELSLLSSDDDVMNKLSLYQQFANTRSLSAKERIKIFKETVKPLTVGMLSRFRNTRRVDAFGRKGDGIPIECRVAIFRKIDKEGNVYFWTFNGNTFCTRLHYSMDNDGEILSKPEVYDVAIPIGDVGLYDKYLGALYHFNRPIQYEPSDSITTYKINDDGEVTTRKVTLPEYIKLVLDDFNVRYNGEELLKDIAETNRQLRKFWKNREGGGFDENDRRITK
jgi:hypothetical protein